MRTNYVVKRNGIVQSNTASLEMKDSIRCYIVNHVVCDDYTAEEYNQALMMFMEDDTLTCEKLS